MGLLRLFLTVRVNATCLDQHYSWVSSYSWPKYWFQSRPGGGPANPWAYFKKKKISLSLNLWQDGWFPESKHFVCFITVFTESTEEEEKKILKELTAWEGCKLTSSLYFQVCYIMDWRNMGDTVTLKKQGRRLNTIFTNLHLRLNCLALTIVAAVKHFWINYNNNIYDHITIIYYQSKSMTFFFVLFQKHRTELQTETRTSQPMTSDEYRTKRYLSPQITTLVRLVLQGCQRQHILL